MLEANFIRGFVQRVGQLDMIVDPVSGREIRVRDAKVRHAETVPHGRAGGGLQNRVSRFIFRTGGWGKSRAAVIVEARSYCRSEMLQSASGDDQPIGRAEFSEILNQLARDKKRRGSEEAFRVVIAASPAGFSDHALSLVDDPERSDRFHDRHIALVLVNMQEGRAYYDQSDSRLDCFLPVIDPSRWDTVLGGIAKGIRSILDRQNSVTVSQAITCLETGAAKVYGAFLRMAAEGCKLDHLDDMGWVLSTH